MGRWAVTKSRAGKTHERECRPLLSKLYRRERDFYFCFHVEGVAILYSLHVWSVICSWKDKPPHNSLPTHTHTPMCVCVCVHLPNRGSRVIHNHFLCFGAAVAKLRLFQMSIWFRPSFTCCCFSFFSWLIPFLCSILISRTNFQFDYGIETSKQLESNSERIEDDFQWEDAQHLPVDPYKNTTSKSIFFPSRYVTLL